MGCDEILNGLRCYFDKALPIILLYKKECHQYQEAVRDNVSSSSVYGAEHLLHLFGFCKIMMTNVGCCKIMMTNVGCCKRMRALSSLLRMMALELLKEVAGGRTIESTSSCMTVVISIG
ncbi:hypothetical protein CDL12_11362 [Handroanthus impetiginosus]|uniref:MRG domain-containing protein n=1 Tax=Handroanthus impetiginosus TaxID=429701 RepID=A0A2G9HEP4_9LAMI|nr:hypothetical protein CDL12_11362 [Handroanthus impetiginosus]